MARATVQDRVEKGSYLTQTTNAHQTNKMVSHALKTKFYSNLNSRVTLEDGALTS